MLTQQELEIDADQPAPQPQVMGGVVNPMGNPTQGGVEMGGPPQKMNMGGTPI